MRYLSKHYYLISNRLNHIHYPAVGERSSTMRLPSAWDYLNGYGARVIGSYTDCHLMVIL